MRLNYEIKGKGKTLIFLPGLGLNLHVFDFIAEILSPEYRCVMVDNLGVGKSQVPKGPYTIEMMARAVMEIVEEESFKSSIIVGHSMGGFIALTLALNNPAYFSKLVLLCSSPSFFDTTLSNRERKKKGASLKEAISAQVKRFVADNFYESGSSRFEWFVNNRIENQVTATGIDGQLSAVFSFDVTDKLANITQDSLVVAGEKDKLIPAEVSLQMSKLMPNSKIEYLKDTGHLPMIECPEETAALILKFVN